MLVRLFRLQPSSVWFAGCWDYHYLRRRGKRQCQNNRRRRGMAVPRRDGVRDISRSPRLCSPINLPFVCSSALTLSVALSSVHTLKDTRAFATLRAGRRDACGYLLREGIWDETAAVVLRLRNPPKRLRHSACVYKQRVLY